MKRVLMLLSSRRVVPWVLVTLVLLVIADGFLTNLLIQRDIAHEWNPLLVVLAGKGVLLAVKAIGAVVCAFVLWDIYKHWPRLGLISSYGFLAVYSGIILWNLWLYMGAYH